MICNHESAPWMAQPQPHLGNAGWYEALLPRLLAVQGQVGVERLTEIAAAPLHIRGFGPVKEQAETEVRSRVETRLQALG